MLAVDRFKMVNDRYWHAAGDAVLAVIWEALRACLRASDAVARLGGDKFVALLPEASMEDAQRVAEMIWAQVQTQLQHWPGAAPGVAVLMEITSGTVGACLREHQYKGLRYDRSGTARGGGMRVV